MRKFDLDGNVDPEAVALGELIMKVSNTRQSKCAPTHTGLCMGVLCVCVRSLLAGFYV